MRLSIITIFLINTLVYTSCLGARTEFEGKWLVELTNGYVLFMNFKPNQTLTVGQIANSSGPLEIEKFDGKWKLDNDTLKLRLPDLNQILKIERVYQDSIVFIPDESNDISLKKIVKLFHTSKSSQIKIEKELVGKTMIDSNHNSYEFLNSETFKYTNLDKNSSQNKNWYILDFEGTMLVALGEYEWFANRMILVPSIRNNNKISFKYYYKNQICDFELSHVAKKK